MASVEIDLFDLAVFVEEREGDPYDRAIEWAQGKGIGREYIEYVWDQFSPKDRKQFVGLCHDVQSMVVDLSPHNSDAENEWMIPESFESPDVEHKFSLFLVSRRAPHSDDQVYTSDGEFLVPAPYGIKPKRTIQHGWHFLIGVESGLPAICGQVEGRDPITAQQFLDLVTASACPQQMKGLRPRDIAYFLSRVSSMSPGKYAGVSYRDIQGAQGTRTELAVKKTLG